MNSSPPKNVTQTNVTQLTPEQKAVINKGMGLVDQSLAGGGPKLPDVAGFDPLQTQAQEGVINKAGGELQTMSSNLAGAQNFLTGDVMNLDSNPYLKGAVDAAIRPLTEQFTSTVIPGLRTNAINAGALGRKKDTFAQTRAAEGYERAVGDTSSTMLNKAYADNLDALTRGVAMAPQSMSATLFPEAALDSVGAQRRELQQAQGSQAFNQQMLPFTLGSQLLGNAGSIPGAGSTSSVQGATPSTPGWQQALGGGLTLASLLSGFGAMAAL